MKRTGKDIDKYISIPEGKYKLAIAAEAISIALAVASIAVYVLNKED